MLKRLLPKSLFGRFLLIILLPNIFVQSFATYMFYKRHWFGVSRYMASALAGDIAWVDDVLMHKTMSEEELRKKALSWMELRIISLKEAYKLPHYLSDRSLVNLKSAMDNRLTHRNYMVAYRDKTKSEVVVDLIYTDGVWRVVASSKRLANPSTYIFIMWMVGAALFFITIALFFMRNQVRSIAELSRAADAFGKGQKLKNYKPSGAAEVRRAGQALMSMKKNLDKQVEQRVTMLSGISHDLKTPLTRMKLQLALLTNEKEAASLEENVVEMEKMVQGFLDFAKGSRKQYSEPVNIADLLRSVVAGYRKEHGRITVNVPAGLMLSINKGALRRVMTNLFDNGLRHANKIEVSALETSKHIMLYFDDDGPGIPPSKRGEALKPFVRLDESRHLEEASTGLGLAITKDIMTEYGGTIELDESPLKGLRVVLSFPRISLLPEV